MADKKPTAETRAPEKKAPEKKAKKGGVKAWFGRVRKYFKDTRSELKKVVWPSRKETQNNTIVVLAVVIVSAVFMLVLDIVFGGAIHLMIGA